MKYYSIQVNYNKSGWQEVARATSKNEAVRIKKLKQAIYAIDDAYKYRIILFTGIEI